MTKHLQKFTAVLLAVIMTLGVFAVVPFTASAATISDGTEVSDMASSYGHVYGTLEENTGIYYSIIDDGTIEITGCIGTATEITIPSEIDGYKVTSIVDWAFENCYSLTSITIPDSVTSIGYGVFMSCTSLTNITIPDSVTSIGDRAFEYCYSLTSITIPDSVTSIGDYAFDDCSNLASINVNNNNVNYSSIDGVLFNKNKTVLIEYPQEKTDENYTIPDSVTSIGYRAFSSCENLTSITIPDSVTSIDESAFSDTAWFNNQPDGLVYAGKVAYKYKGEMPENTSLIIKDGTKSIADYAFENCYSLTSITIPDSVTSIGYGVFMSCTSLTNITIPDSVTSIGDSAFEYCYSLTSITIPDSVTFIDSWAFAGCSSLTNITIPDSVSSIGYCAFSGTAWFDNQPDGLVYAGKVAYKYKGEMPENTSLIIKEGTKSICGSAFEGCENLTNITIPDSVTSIDESAFEGCTNLTSVTIPDSVTSITIIGNRAFFGCEKLTSITIPDSVTSIGNCAFYNCKSLTSVTIPDGVTYIGEDAFMSCTNLTSITIPNSVTSIGWGAFGYYTTPPGEGGMAALPIENFTISGYKGTAAEKYANENGFKFIVLDDTSKPSLGDIDGDGEISVNDVTVMQKYIVQLKPFTDEQMKFADVDKNGKIDVYDVTLLQKVIVKIAVI